MLSDSEKIESPANTWQLDLPPGWKAEIEYKLLADSNSLAQIRQAMAAQKYVQGASVHEDLVNNYYDTPDHQLRRAGLSLRVRWNGSVWVQSFKQKRESSSGIYRRAEWERTIATSEPELDDLDKLKLPIIAAQIGLIFTTRFHRETFSLNTLAHHAAQKPGTLRMSLDEGNIQVGEKMLPIFEVEFELESGSEANLRLVGHDFMAQFRLKPGQLSKAERAYRMLRNLKFPESI